MAGELGAMRRNEPGSMGETPDQIRRETGQARNRLDQGLKELECKVKSGTDWRVQFNRYP